MALFTVTTAEKVNQPPSQVGDGLANTTYGITYTFTVADFTTFTSPPYADPEGDAAFQLKVTSLPTVGSLTLNGVTVTVNQIINFDDIAAGLFKFIPDNATTTSYNSTFNFEIADSGSGQFVG